MEQIQVEGAPLPKLEDVLGWARDVGVILSLDIKNFFHPEGDVAKEVIRCLERTNTKENVVLLFMDHSELFHTKLAHPELAVRALLIGRLMSYHDYLQSIRADSVSISYAMFRPRDVDEIHSAGIAVALGGVWNPNTDVFRSIDIDIFSHGSPAEARKILDRQSPQSQ